MGMAVYVVIRNSKPVTADVALVVSHDVQHHGVGTVLVEHLGSLARRPRTGRPLREFGVPVAVKAVADGLLHKSRGGGVRLGLATEADVRVLVQPMSRPDGSCS
ncbi:hypothetical protein GCM10029964_053520 [Kibdelosporangium lantanae]